MARNQCDQIARISFQYLAILIMKICPIAQNICQHDGSQFDKILENPSKIAKDFQNVAKVVKFRQIWSLCSQPALLQCTASKISILNHAATTIIIIKPIGNDI